MWATGDLVDAEAEREKREADQAALAADLAALGVPVDGPVRPVGQLAELNLVYLWPENLPSWLLWLEVQTQWRRDFGARTGLDYASITAGWLTPRQCRQRRRSRERLLADLQAMELAALAAWAKQEQSKPKTAA